MSRTIDPRLPTGPIAGAWQRTREALPLISPLRKRQMEILVVGTGLAGASAAATLAEQGYRVTVLTYHDSPRRAHSVAAQGGINAARPVAVDGDSVSRLFADTLKAATSAPASWAVSDWPKSAAASLTSASPRGCRSHGNTAAASPPAASGGAGERTFYARGQTGQQLLYGAYQAMMRQVELGTIRLLTRRDLVELITVDGVARGAVTRHGISGALEVHTASAVLLCSGGYSNVYFLSTNALKSNASAIWRAHQKGALFANPCFTQIHPTCIPSGDAFQSKLTLMSESLRNDGRIWLPAQAGDDRPAKEIPEQERDYFLERMYPTYGNMTPRDVASRRARELCNAGHGVGPGGRSVYLDLTAAIARDGAEAIAARYGNLMEMYERITGEDPYSTPMRIYPAPHYTMGGLWVDYQLMSSIPGLFVLGEANFSEHGANRLGASALMQGLADGYFIAPATVTAWLAGTPQVSIDPSHPSCRDALHSAQTRLDSLLATQGSTPVDAFHRELGNVMIERCGISRDAAGLEDGLRAVAALEQRFLSDVRVPGEAQGTNPELEKAVRVQDFFGLAELMLRDALAREESCGAHFREEHQSADGEAQRDDTNFAHIAAWEANPDGEPIRHSEPLQFTTLQPTTRRYT